MDNINAKHVYSEAKALSGLAVPLIITGMVNAPLGFFSTLLLAHLGHPSLAAGAIVIWLYSTLMTLAWGILSAISILVARHCGANDTHGIGAVLRDGLLFVLLVSFPLMLLIWHTPFFLLYFGQEPIIVVLASTYLHALTWSIPPNLFILVLEQFLIGLGQTRVNLGFTIFFVPLNIVTSYLLMFGKIGLPAFGISGLGWGVTISTWILAVCLSFYIYKKKYYREILMSARYMKHHSRLGELLYLGLPMGAMFSMELAFFLTLALFMGYISSHALAANQITMQYMGILATIIFCTAQAITVRISYSVGANEIHNIPYITISGIMIACLFAFIIATTYWFMPELYIAIDLNVHDPRNYEVLLYTKQFFAVAAIFQILEAARIGLFGALRGLGDMRFVLLTSIIMFWGIAFPVGYYLAIVWKWQGVGFWWGITFGSAFGIALLMMRLCYLSTKKYLIINNSKAG